NCVSFALQGWAKSIAGRIACFDTRLCKKDYTRARPVFRCLMSALGQKQTYAVQNPMSALPPKADSCSAQADVRFGPKADMDYFTQFLPSGDVNVNRPDSVQSMRIGSPVNIMLARAAIVRARIAKVIKRIVIANEVGIVISPGARRINWITSDIERPVDTEATSGCDRYNQSGLLSDERHSFNGGSVGDDNSKDKE